MSGTRRGGGGDAQESERTRARLSRRSSEVPFASPRNLGPVRRVFKADDLYRVVFLRFLWRHLKGKVGEAAGKKKNNNKKTNPALEAFFIPALYVPQGRQEVLGDDM